MVYIRNSSTIQHPTVGNEHEIVLRRCNLTVFVTINNLLCFGSHIEDQEVSQRRSQTKSVALSIASEHDKMVMYHNSTIWIQFFVYHSAFEGS